MRNLSYIKVDRIQKRRVNAKPIRTRTTSAKLDPVCSCKRSLRVSPGIGMLRLNKRYLPLETIQMMHRSLIEPYFRNCCPVLG